MKYIVATDYDGTLRQNNCISEKTMEAINAFRAKGNLFGVVTGRNYVNGFEVFKKEKLFPFDYVITHNGAAAFDADDNNYFAEHINGSIPWKSSTLAEALIEKCTCLSDDYCSLSLERETYGFNIKYPDGEENENWKFSPKSILKNIGMFVSAGVVCKNEAHAEEVIGILNETFGDYINPIQNGRCIDITPSGIDKATGIAKLANCLDVPLENIWTSGDNYNDMAMLEKYHGCAISSGVPEIRNVSEYVCDTVADVIELAMKAAE